MRVWHFNGVNTTYGKWDCRNSWRYTSLAVNRGAIKQGFTVQGRHVATLGFQANDSWLLLLNAAYLAEKQQILIPYSLV